MDLLGIGQAQRGLVDPKPDARSAALLTVANRSVALFKEMPFERACSTVQQQCAVIDAVFLKVAAPAHRRGGLLCVRGILTGLPSRQYPAELVARFCALVLPSVSDNDASVRLASAEACHELIKRFNFQVLHGHLSDFFTATSRLVSDQDRKIALVGQEVSATAREYICGSDLFQLDTNSFVGFVVAAVGPPAQCRTDSAPSPPEVAIGLWVLGWVRHVSGLTGAPLVPFTDVLMSALFPLTTVVALADEAFRTLRILGEAFMGCLDSPQSVPTESVLRVVNDALRGEGASTEMCVLGYDWLLSMAREGACRGAMVQFAPTLLLVSLEQFAKEGTLPRARAQALLDELAHITAAASEESHLSGFPAIAQTLNDFLRLDTTWESPADMQMILLQWVALLHRCAAAGASSVPLENLVDGVLSLVCRTEYSAVVEAGCATLVLLVAPDERQEVLQELLARIQSDPRRLLPRLPQIAVVMHADATSTTTIHSPRDGSTPPATLVMVTLSRVLSKCADTRFVSKAVMTLNGALLSFPEFADTRDSLRVHAHTALFDEMVATWRFHPVSLLALAWLCRRDDCALAVTGVMGSVELSPVTLLQLDRLVQLLESPVFIPLRSRLASPDDCPVLLRSLLAVLMLLPQTSPQYAALRERCSLASGVLQWRESAITATGTVSTAAVARAVQEAMNALELQEKQSI